ncbi:MAG: STAS domain-containing protein [Planctomycetota bacterium]
MSITSHMEGDICIIQIQSGLSSELHIFLKEKLRELVRNGSVKIILDLSRAGFVSSSLIGAMVYGLKEVRKKKGDLILAEVDEAFMDVLRVTRLDQAFISFETVEEATKNGFKSAS